MEAKDRKIEIQPDGIWYHGSNKIFSELRTDSTITQWKELAEAFSHQPSRLGYDDNGVIGHNGTEKEYLYIIDEPIIVKKKELITELLELLQEYQQISQELTMSLEQSEIEKNNLLHYIEDFQSIESDLQKQIELLQAQVINLQCEKQILQTLLN